MRLLNAYDTATQIHYPLKNQAVSATQVWAAMFCHTVINSLSETLFKVTKKCILDEMATCLTFKRNNLPCFIIELSQRMRKSKSSRTFHIESAFSPCQDCSFLLLKRKKEKKKNRWIISWGFFFPLEWWEQTAFSIAITVATIWLNRFNFFWPL